MATGVTPGSRASIRQQRRWDAGTRLIVEDTPEGVLVVARLPRRELRRYAPFLFAGAAPKRRRKAT